MSPAWSGRPERCANMSPTLTILVTTGSDNAKSGSFETMGVSQSIAFVPTWCATTVALSGLDSDASWKTVSGPIFSPLRTSLTPKPLAYTLFPPCTTAMASPGMPDFFIRSSVIPSSLATAFSTAFSGRGIAGTNGGGTSDCAEAVGGGGGWDGLELQLARDINSSAVAATLASAFMSAP